jgi:hypothetical protein
MNKLAQSAVNVTMLTILVMLLPACYIVEPGYTESLLRIDTDKQQYRFGTDQQVQVLLTNQSDVPVYILVPGGFLELDKKTPVGWQNLGVWYGWIAIGPFPYAIEPGDTFPGVPLHLTAEIVDGSGLYRFRFNVYKDTKRWELLPLATRVSNPFEISGSRRQPQLHGS